MSAQPSNALALTFDNDAIGLHGKGAAPDYDYSSGVALLSARAVAPRWIRKVVRAPYACDTQNGRERTCALWSYGLSHQIYTPRLNADSVLPGQRPYAGWIGGAVNGTRVHAGRSRTIGLEIGAIGPVALASPVQNALHRLFEHRTQLGWRHQIGNIAGVTLRIDERARRERLVRGHTMAIDAHVTAMAGNVVDAASAGVDVTIGFGPQVPWSSLEPRIVRPRALFVTVGYQQDAIAHSAFIDGLAGSPSARRIPFVGQFAGGVGVRHRGWYASYRHVVRGREYAAEPGRHAYGSLSIAVNHR